MIWSLRMTPNRSTGYTPFFLVYGAKAVLPVDIEYARREWSCTRRRKQKKRERTESTS